MQTETERLDAMKAMAFDLFDILDQKPERTAYTKEELKKLIREYIKNAD